MIATDVLVLLGAGVLAGVLGTVVGVASIASYPALLAVGLPPLSANVTNTVALTFTAVGATAGSRRELEGQRARIRRLWPLAALGGAAGAALLLLTPSRTFPLVVPWLIGAASLVLLLRPLTARLVERPNDEHGGLSLLAVFGVAIYLGYFGAAGGIVMLAVLAATIDLPLARVNAVKNVLSGPANAVAAVGFAFFGPVRWAAVLPLAAGFLAGGWLGPSVVRWLPGGVLRVAVAVCGAAMAVKLGADAY